MAFLYDILLQYFGRRTIERTEVSSFLSDGLNRSFKQRPYQKEAFQRFSLLYSEDFEGKPPRPLHIMYNMATGSGKTYVMAGLILYLYEKGYRNFIFFVNSNNIINKTRDNFLNEQASKYLFNNEIVHRGQKVYVKELENLEESDNENINIKFTTIQQLHLDLNTPRENGLTYEDFDNQKIVLLADEAHHLNSATRGGGILFGSWEDTVMNILNRNYDNILLEFTATLDYDSREITKKYADKVIYKYDLAQFRKDRYSKEISLIRSSYDEEERILQALILNLYRQELATGHNINLKPVVLFKAKRTIAESTANKEKFHKLIDELDVTMLEKIQKTSTVSIVQKAFSFFEQRKISLQAVVERTKANFKFENCISANNDAEAELNQMRLNTLEDENNPIRAVFAVQKLNEGWDVLNLFDIVRLYDGQDGRTDRPGKTTIAEAQLIGRGARYFPFSLNEGDDRFTRKFDCDISNDLRVLEELYYHTREDSRYISELKRALIDTGIYDDEDELVTKQLKLKKEFKQTDFYKNGYVFYNKRKEKSYNNIKSFSDLGVSKQNYTYQLSSGGGKTSLAFDDKADNEELDKVSFKNIEILNIPLHIIRYALSQNPFFHFSNLSIFFPNLNSLQDFMLNANYLGSLEIKYMGADSRLSEMTNADYLYSLNGLLGEIEQDIKGNLTEYEGSDYIKDYIHKIFVNKEIRVSSTDERARGQEEIVQDKDWYVYNANYGTREEKKFVELFASRFDEINEKYDNVYLIRNERIIKIFDELGRAFEPDFLLFCKQRNKEQITYQIFVEPKGNHLTGYDKWKEDFLKEIRDSKLTMNIETDEYLITGVPFYNYDNENEFKKALYDVLDM